MRKAYSYIRWSSGKQKDGASLSRQDTQDPLVSNFIKTHKLNVVETMIDSGVSGFRGKNFSGANALGKFIEQIRLGNIERGSVIFFENMDRFGRDTNTNMIKRFIEIIECGVSIGIVAMDTIIDLEMMNSNNMVWNYVNGEMQRARAESNRKQTFSKKNISNKVEAAKKGELIYFGGMCPSWITGIKNKSGERIVKGTADKIGVEWIKDDKKVATLKRVFRLYLEGKASTNIAQILNTDKVKSLKTGGTWNNTTVKRLLSSKSAMGRGKINDFEVENYYPEIISKNDFYKVQARLALNKGNRGGSPSGKVPNLFKGLTSCTCGSGITVFSSIAKGKRYNYCQCTEAKLKGECDNSARWDMFRLERQIFFLVLEKLPQELLHKPKSKNDSVLDDLNGELNKVESDISDAVKTLGKVKVAQLETRLIELQQKQSDLQDKIAEQKNKMTIAEASPHAINKLKELFASVNMHDWAVGMIQLEKELADVSTREQLRNLMPDIIKKLILNFNKSTYAVIFTNGKSIPEMYADARLEKDLKNQYKQFKKSQKKLATE
jgi:hypothetical protein